MTVAEKASLSSLGEVRRGGFIDAARERAHVSRYLDRFRVKTTSLAERVRNLSGGNQQKVALARLLHHDVDVLLLDEPTRGIDVGSKAQIYRAIDDLARRGKAILMVSSYLPELIGVCDRVAVMCRGVLGPARRVEEVSEHQIMLEATGAASEDKVTR